MLSRALITLAVLNMAAMAGLAAAFWSHRSQSQQELEELRAAVRELSVASKQARDSRRAAAEALAIMARASTARPPPPQALPQPTPETDEAPANEAPPPAPPPPATYEQSKGRVLTAHSSEAVDERWSQEASRRLTATILDHLPGGSRLKSLDCRSTMCRVEIAHQDHAAHGPFLRRGFSGWPGSVFVAGEQEDAGELIVTLFAAREGTEFPFTGP